MFSKIHFFNTETDYENTVNLFIKDWFNKNDFINSKTSGSTGKPKEIKLKKEYLRASARMTGFFFQLKENDSLLLSLPIWGIGGKMIVIRAIEFNCNLVVVNPQFNPLEFVQKIPFKIISLVPYQLNKIIEKNINLLDNVENIIIGGAALNETLKNKLLCLKSNYYESFGMTETYSHIALKNIKTDEYFTLFQDIKISTIENCLKINSEHLGVINLETNDIVEIINEKQFRWIGRKDYVINSGGIKLHPEQIEQKLEKLIQYPFFIAKQSDTNLGEIVILIIENVQINEKKLRERISNLLTSYENPKKIYYLESFVYTPTQKINRIETLKQIIF